MAEKHVKNGIYSKIIVDGDDTDLIPLEKDIWNALCGVCDKHKANHGQMMSGIFTILCSRAAERREVGPLAAFLKEVYETLEEHAEEIDMGGKK